MPLGLTTFQETQPIAQATSFTSADTTVAKSILAQQTSPFRIDDIVITSDDTVDRVVDIYLRTVSTNTLLGSVTVPAGAGHGGVVPAMFFYDNNITPFLGFNMNTNQTLQASIETTMTAAKTIVITPFGGQF